MNVDFPDRCCSFAAQFSVVVGVLKVLQRSYFHITILVRLPRLRGGTLGAQALVGTAVFRLRQSAGASRRRETPT
jgi:hypothetical protein